MSRSGQSPEFCTLNSMKGRQDINATKIIHYLVSCEPGILKMSPPACPEIFLTSNVSGGLGGFATGAISECVHFHWNVWEQVTGDLQFVTSSRRNATSF